MFVTESTGMRCHKCSDVVVCHCVCW